jgi:3-oxoacyl-[acyl-carrier-protein] synthase II
MSGTNGAPWVTGLGVETPIGSTTDALWDSLVTGRSGAREVRSFDTSPFPNRRGCEIDDPSLPDAAPDDRSPRGRCTELAVRAAMRALADAGLDRSALDRDDAALVVGTTMGEVTRFERERVRHADREPDAADVSSLVERPLDVMARAIADVLGVRGAVVSVPAACAAGTYAVGLAASLVRTGRAGMALAVGCEAFSRLAFVGFSRMHAMSSDACRPFSLGRPGLLLGEGAGALVIEPGDAARRRSAPHRGSILGFGLSCDAFHITAPHQDGAGAAAATRDALRRAGVSPAEVDYVNAHGTGTPLNDKVESLAMRAVFGDHLDRLPVSSIKALTGHMMGASGAVETIASLLAMERGVVPPTWNWVERDPDCDVDCVPNEPRERRMRRVVSNSYAFGGNNASVVLGAAS